MDAESLARAVYERELRAGTRRLPWSAEPKILRDALIRDCGHALDILRDGGLLREDEAG